MCGIYGMVSRAGAPLRHPGWLDEMRRVLAHRGPDGHGRISRPHAAIGVNRLRIVDLSPRADQPLSDPDGCAWLALNGEIYNSSALRRRYPRYPFRSGSDAEVVIPLYLERGPAGLADLEGMFALALWDEGARRLTLARDRAGEKPLFLTEHGGEIWFASEVQALLHSAVPRSLDHAAFADAMRLGYVLEPRTPFEAVRRVGAGTIETIGFESDATIRYWGEEGRGDGEEGRGKREEYGGSAEGRLEELLTASVRKQLVADVPVGVFLSGGVDSALLAAIAQSESGTPLHTFTVRFADRSYDEGAAARATAARLGTRHLDVAATDDAIIAQLAAFTRRSGEPVADPAVLPTAELAARAREQVGVVLTGEGADELFGGYPTYQGHRLARGFNALPAPLRGATRGVVNALPSSSGKVPLEFLLKRFVAAAEFPWLERHMAWFGTGLPAETLHPDLPSFASAFSAPSAVNPSVDRAGPALLDLAMKWDYATYLRDQLLVKTDRATMLASLEARAPYLDRELTRFAFALPASFKVRGVTGKWLLRRVARRWLPATWARRTKRGLSVPVSRLLNGPLAPEVDRLLAPARLARQGLLNPTVVGELVSSHRRGRSAVARGLWTLLVWQLWLEHWIPEGRE